MVDRRRNVMNLCGRFSVPFEGLRFAASGVD